MTIKQSPAYLPGLLLELFTALKEIVSNEY